MRIRTVSFAALVASALLAPAAQAGAADTFEISLVAPSGIPLLDVFGSEADLSADGRFVAVATTSPLVSDDTDGAYDVYRLDRATGDVLWASRAPAGQPQDLPAEWPSISRDGRYVAFHTPLNLVPSQRGSTAAHEPQVFRFDATTRAHDLVSVNQDGVTSRGPANYARISGDGRVVVFTSRYSDFGVADGNRRQDVYRRDMTTGTTTLASRTASGSLFTCSEAYASGVSTDGRYVLFSTRCADPSTTDTNGKSDIFRYDAASGTARLVSLTYDGKASGAAGSGLLDDTGRAVVYQSLSPRIVAGDTPDTMDIFKADLSTGSITRVAGTGRTLAIEVRASFANGRHILVYEPTQHLGSVVIRLDTVTGAMRRVSKGDDGRPAFGAAVALSADGQTALFGSEAGDLDAEQVVAPGATGKVYAWESTS
jgi:Tol biopolymer transport system component